MKGFGLQQARRVLCLGAHSDDIEIGAGATLLSLIESVPELEVLWVVFSASGARAEEARRSADEFLRDVQSKEVIVGAFRESFFPSDWLPIKQWCEDLRTRFEPDLVFTHFRDDRHQDHRVVSDLTWNTFRDHLILEYEILKFDGDLGHPNVFVPLSEGACSRKIDFLMKHFGTQSSKHWFSPESFAALHRIRGIECASPTGFAEAFHGRKVLLETL